VQETATKLLESKLPELLQRSGEAVLEAENSHGDLSIVVHPGRIREVLEILKTESSLQYAMLMDLFGMDYLKFQPETPERFAVVYILYSMTQRSHLRVKVYLPESQPDVDSVHDLFKSANWFEREAWDLYGINFRNHPNLVRILCHIDFVGHALRKDYPSDGYQRLKSAAPSTGF
jgi:NADH-quinone oxidoreductase subunit C